MSANANHHGMGWSDPITAAQTSDLPPDWHIPGRRDVGSAPVVPLSAVGPGQACRPWTRAARDAAAKGPALKWGCLGRGPGKLDLDARRDQGGIEGSRRALASVGTGAGRNPTGGSRENARPGNFQAPGLRDAIPIPGRAIFGEPAVTDRTMGQTQPRTAQIHGQRGTGPQPGPHLSRGTKKSAGMSHPVRHRRPGSGRPWACPLWLPPGWLKNQGHG
jgi:hypothetical protein